MYVQLDKSSDDAPPPLQLLMLQNIKDNSLSAFCQCCQITGWFLMLSENLVSFWQKNDSENKKP